MIGIVVEYPPVVEVVILSWFACLRGKPILWLVFDAVFDFKNSNLSDNE